MEHLSVSADSALVALLRVHSLEGVEVSPLSCARAGPPGDPWVFNSQVILGIPSSPSTEPSGHCHVYCVLGILTLRSLRMGGPSSLQDTRCCPLQGGDVDGCSWKALAVRGWTGAAVGGPWRGPGSAAPASFIPADSRSFLLQYEKDELSCEMLALAAPQPAADSLSEAG